MRKFGEFGDLGLRVVACRVKGEAGQVVQCRVAADVRQTVTILTPIKCDCVGRIVRNRQSTGVGKIGRDNLGGHIQLLAIRCVEEWQRGGSQNAYEGNDNQQFDQRKRTAAMFADRDWRVIVGWLDHGDSWRWLF